MMKTKSTLVVLGLTLLLAVAGALVYAAGTSLNITFDDATVVCNGDGTATVTFNYTVISTAAADAATVTGDLDGTPLGTIQTIASGNVANGGGWTFAGRIKTADGSYTTTLSGGEHTFTVCATQAGSNGNPDKKACASQTITVNCAVTGTCPNSEVFGEMVGNHHLCETNNNLEIQFRGDFGDTATLEIDGPEGSGWSTTVPVSRAGKEGNSCVYHYNWDPQDSNSAGSGTYTFKVSGNGHNLSFSATLEDCPGPP